MPTPNDYQNWTAAGADQAAQDTYTAVKAALKDLESRRGLEIFLQGSYANRTNIRADSDVDIVVMTHNTYEGSIDRLGTLGSIEYAGLPRASYTAFDLRRDVMAALVSYFGGARVHSRNKCIKVDRKAGYVDADVVPCLEYRYYPLKALSLKHYTEGVKIYPANGGSIVNFPKQHRENGAVKNEQCDQRYKKTVRQIKQLRKWAVEHGYLEKGIAPGYLLECMTYNVPPERFLADDAQRVASVLLWLKGLACRLAHPARCRRYRSSPRGGPPTPRVQNGPAASRSTGESAATPLGLKEFGSRRPETCSMVML